tara:strand:- start:267 stop:623 length:357 start_codon:yes stop_codon:yes gene_type:complete
LYCRFINVYTINVQTFTLKGLNCYICNSKVLKNHQFINSDHDVFYAGWKIPAFFFDYIYAMIKQNWHPVHWLMIAFAICMILLLIQFNYIIDQCKPVDKNNVNDTLHIEQSHEFGLNK